LKDETVGSGICSITSVFQIILHTSTTITATALGHVSETKIIFIALIVMFLLF
jgi:hypothetical protein